MEQFLSMLAEVSLAMAVVIAVLLALSRVLERQFVPQWRCWAWLAVALRLCLPFNLSLAQAPVVLEAPRAAVRVERQVSPKAGPTRWSWNTSPAAAGAPSMERVVRTEDGPAGSGGEDAAPVVEVRRIPAEWLLAFLWGAGALLFLGDQILHCRAFRRRIRRWSRPARTYGGIPLLECGLVGTPLLMGWLRPVIVTPTGGAEEAALLHEYTHARRRDLWFQLLLVLANAIHWFNPLVWGMRRVAERDVEMACDAQVLQGLGPEERRAYGRVLLRAVSMSAPALTTSFSGEKRALKRRLRAVMDGGPKRPGRAALAVLCTAVALAGGLVACRTAALPQTPPVQETGEPRTPLERFEPQSLTLTYTGPDGEKHRPVMIHRVVFGSIERFIGILTEHFAGAFPLWLSPVQAKIMTITDRADAAARALQQKLEKAGVRTEIDLRNEKIGFKIREARNMKIPYLLVLGDREAQEGTVSVTLRGGHDLGSMPVDALIARMRQEIETKAR